MNLQFKIHDPNPKGGAARAGPSTALAPDVSERKLPNHSPKEAGSTTASSTGAATTGKRKRAKPNEPEWSEPEEDPSESESEDEAVAGGISVGFPGLSTNKGKGTKKRSRLPGACTHCKKLKMKCDFPKGENTCRRCKAGRHVCVVEGRKGRTAPNKREYLLAQIRQKDAIIESLLKQVHNPYQATPLSIASYRMATSPSDESNTSILGWLDRLQSSVRDAGSKGGPQAFFNPRGDKIEELSDTEDEGGQEGDHDDISEPASSDPRLELTLPETYAPLGLIADLSLSNSKHSKKKPPKTLQDATVAAEEDYNNDNVGVANDTYFMPGPATDLGLRATMLEQHSPPDILVHSLVTPEDVEKLFAIFWEKINPFISLLDPVLHTPATTIARCPFLFTVICAISSRFYTEKSQIYPIAMHFAKRSAATALIDGWKSVELCQAYILMSIYAVPARRWEEDRSWLYTGLAIRLATDLNLHHVYTGKPTSEKQEREMLNKTRVWMICYNLDRSTATQFGKPSTIKDDFVVNKAGEWYKQSKYNLPYDIHLSACCTLLKIVAEFHDKIHSDPSSPTGLNKNVDFRQVTKEHDKKLEDFEAEWTRRFAEGSKADDPGCAFRCSLMPFMISYSRLVMFSFGFEQAFRRGISERDGYFFSKSAEAAKNVVECLIDKLVPSGYIRYSPDGHFVFASFASAFLLKLLRPEFSALMKKDQESETFELIGRLIQTLSSTKIAVDDRHTPKLYARFLAGLLSRNRHDGATVGRLQTQPPQRQETSYTGGSASRVPATGGSTSTLSGNLPIPRADQAGPGFGGMGVQQLDSIIYMQEATFASGTGQIQFGMDDFDMASSEETALATMQAISDPAWWKTMMMPGFTWGDAPLHPSASSPMSQPSSQDSPPAYTSYSDGGGYGPRSMMNYVGATQGSFGIFNAQIALHH